MSTGTYGHLIKPLQIGAIDRGDGNISFAAGPGGAGRMIRLRGRDQLEGVNLNLTWGVHTETGDWHAGLDPHSHPFPECLIFVGMDTANVKYLGAEVSCCLGPEQETYTFTDPTMVFLPPGLPHGPITTKRVYSPRGFGCWSVEMSAGNEITWMGEGVSDLTEEQREAAPEGMKFVQAEKSPESKPAGATKKYAHLVQPMKSLVLRERGEYNTARFSPDQLAQHEQKLKAGEKQGPGAADHLVWMSGKELGGLNADIAWGFCSQSGIWRRGVGAHVHPEADEVLIFLGMDSGNIDYLGAEIEVDLGKEHERHLIGKPSAIVCPAGMPHSPQVTHWVDRPFAVFSVCLSGEHETDAFD